MRAPLLAAILLLAAPTAEAGAPSTGLAEIAPGLYVLPGLHEDASPANEDAIANVGFVVGDAAVAVIDPGGSAAHGKRLRAAIASVTPLPVRYVVLTHVHPDHIMGASAFVADAPVFIGHAKLPGALAQRAEFYERMLRREMGEAASAGSVAVAPTELVATTSEIDLGNRVLTIRADGPAHTDNDLSVYDRRTRTLWLGDLLFVDRVPVVDGSLAGWLKELAALRALAADRAVPGHGPPSVPWPQAADAELHYLTVLATETRAAIARGVGIGEAPAVVGLGESGNWLLFDQYHARNVTAAYKELEWE